jgi:signal transduction histidine kinase
MKLPLRFGLTQQFVALFVLTSVVPIIGIALFFYGAVSTTFNERVVNLLDMAVLISNDTVQKGLNNLEFKVMQAANYPIRQAYLDYLKDGNHDKLIQAMREYQKSAHVDMLRLYDTHRHVVAISSSAQASKALTLSLLPPVLRGEVVSSVTRYIHLPDKQMDLAYIAASPMYDASRPRKIIGVLVARYSMSRNFSFQSILKAIPILQIRMLVRDKENGLHLRSFSSPSVNHMPPSALLSQSFKHSYLANIQVSPIILESIGRENFHTIAMTLRHYDGNILGYLLLSCSEKDLAALKEKNLLMIVAYLIFGFLAVGVATFVFKRSFIDPVDELATTSEKVAAGDLALRVQEDQGQPKIQAMMSNFNRMLDQLREDDLLKNTFISTLTHDLRTPLFAQRRVLQTLQGSCGNADPALGEVLAGLDKNNDHLLAMVAMMLEAYQYESGKIALYLERVDLGLLVVECYRSLAPLADSKQIRLENSIPDGQAAGSIQLMADPLQLKRVFVNLINNAIENIQEGRQIGVSAHQKEGFVEVVVVDNGPGISPDILPHIFQRYFTGHPTRQKIGSGLGLFICRMIVELHGGTIAVSSEVGCWTAYRIKLPLALTESLDTESANHEESASDASSQV